MREVGLVSLTGELSPILWREIPEFDDIFGQLLGRFDLYLVEVLEGLVVFAGKRLLEQGVGAGDGFLDLRLRFEGVFKGRFAARRKVGDSSRLNVIRVEESCRLLELSLEFGVIEVS